MGKPYTIDIQLAIDDAESPIDAAAKWKEGTPISVRNVQVRPEQNQGGVITSRQFSTTTTAPTPALNG